MATDIAFALAGLGGFNAHGAGFLTAAGKLGITPDLVTATSGQIIVLGEWLRGTDLETLLVDPNRSSGVLGTVMTAFSGDRGIFRPAVSEYWQRWMTVPKSWAELPARLLPAEQYVPLRSKAYLGEIAALLEGAKFGVVFNAYDLDEGEGVLFGNAIAKTLLKDVQLLQITEEAIESALWLSLYGFNGLPNGRMDGAYFRPCVIAELQDFDKVFAVRPLAQGWVGKTPQSWFDVQDWQTEMWFSAGYKAEVAEMKRINKLIEDGSLKDPDYKKIELIEVCTNRPAGYFNFFTERPEVFKEAYDEAMKKLEPHAKARPSAASAPRAPHTVRVSPVAQDAAQDAHAPPPSSSPSEAPAR